MERGLLKRGENVFLRDAYPSEVEDYLRWMREGEWKDFDAPWEEMDDPQEDLEKRFNRVFLEEKTEPRKRAIITSPEDKPIGWVNRYSKKKHHSVFLIGIDICEDPYLGKGLGTEALHLWIEYLFENSDIHKVGLHTYSYNKKMKRVAEKLGFKEEGIDREIVLWKGDWISRIRYGMIRQEWNKTKKHYLR